MYKMKFAIVGICSVALLAACAPRETLVCDREAQAWDKFNTQSDVCAPVKRVAALIPDGSNPNTPNRPADPVRPDGPDPKDPDPKDPKDPKDPDPKDPKDPKPETPKGQNPGNDKPVGNAPYDGVKGEVPSGKDKNNSKDKGPKGNNGWGNGDQDAPGKSEFKNNAENAGGNANNMYKAPGNSGK
jgi:hypothetical protein